MPIILKNFVRKAQNRMNYQYRHEETTPKKEGEVNISSDPKAKTTGEKDKLGEYVDFEEVKDDTTNDK